MLPHFEYGESVRVIRHLRNDGTYPGMPRGALLVRRGSVGHVLDVGFFLQDQLIYTVHFLELERIVGCREEELIRGEEPWIDRRFETREWVRTRAALTVQGKVIVPFGTSGEVLKVLTFPPQCVHYHVCFLDRILQVPEELLE